MRYYRRVIVLLPDRDLIIQSDTPYHQNNYDTILRMYLILLH